MSNIERNTNSEPLDRDSSKYKKFEPESSYDWDLAYAIQESYKNGGVMSESFYKPGELHGQKLFQHLTDSARNIDFTDKDGIKTGQVEVSSNGENKQISITTKGIRDTDWKESTSRTIIRERAWEYEYWTGEFLSEDGSPINPSEQEFSEISYENLIQLLEKIEQRVLEGQEQEESKKIEDIKRQREEQRAKVQRAIENAQRNEPNPEDGLKDLV